MQNLKRAKVLGVPIDLTDLSQAHKYILEHIEEKKKLHVITINAEIIMLAKENKEFSEIVNNAGLIIPDGSGVVLALKKQKINNPKVAGIELALKCVKDGNSRIFLFGGKEDVIKSAYEKLKTDYPQSNIIGYRNGYFSEDEEEKIIEEINSLNPDILLIGLGVPKQEQWIVKMFNKINASVFIGVGGSFDVFSGKIQRAHFIMRKWHLEWLYRLYKEPWRWKRMLVLPRFVFNVLLYKDK